MNILITGGAGYIGSHTAVALFAAGHIPIILDNFANSAPWIIDRIAEINGVEPRLYEGDVTDQRFVDQVFAEEAIDGVIHFAALKAVDESLQKPLDYYDTNINGLLTILCTMQQHQVEALVFSSSACVYGEAPQQPVSEETPRQEALTPYGNTKIMCEDILRDTLRNNTVLKGIALRYFNPIGAHPSARIGELPRGVPSNLVPYITQTAAGKREQLTIFGDDYDTPDGTCIRDFIHVVDLAQAHIAAIAYLMKQTTGFHDVFNVGTGNGHSVMELIKTFEAVNELTLPYTIGPRREGDIVTSWADTTKIQQSLGWQPQKTLADALRDAWRWEQTQRAT